MPNNFEVTTELEGVSLTFKAPSLQRLVGLGEAEISAGEVERLFSISQEEIKLHLSVYLGCLMGAISARDLPLLANKMSEVLDALKTSSWTEKGQNN